MENYLTNFDNYFPDVASIQKYQNQVFNFPKISFTKNENVSGSAFFKIFWSQYFWSDIPENVKSLSPYSFGKQYKNVLLSCQNSCWLSFQMFVTFLQYCF